MRSNLSKGDKCVWSTVEIVFYSPARTLSFKVSSERKVINVGGRQEWDVWACMDSRDCQLTES